MLTHTICFLRKRDLYHIENGHRPFISNLQSKYIERPKGVYRFISIFFPKFGRTEVLNGPLSGRIRR